jgi:hypothetical protein
MAPRKTAKPAYEYPMCVRHLKGRKDSRLRQFFLCDACAELWSNDAFGGNQPLYVGERLKGFCQLCNARGNGIRMRSWFLCDICCRVASSIGRNYVAERAILDFWKAFVAPIFPSLILRQNDISALHPKRPTDQSATAPIDFLARDMNTGLDVFGIENKTGRSSIRDMSVFQLDVSDCDTILNDMNRLNIPAYLIHAQVLEQWEPPTMGFKIIGLWWSDVYTMAEHFKEMKNRRDEMRGAAYFNKKAFLPIDSFADALWGAKTWALVERFQRDGILPMYRQPANAQ